MFWRRFFDEYIYAVIVVGALIAISGAFCWEIGYRKRASQDINQFILFEKSDSTLNYAFLRLHNLYVQKEAEVLDARRMMVGSIVIQKFLEKRIDSVLNIKDDGLEK